MPLLNHPLDAILNHCPPSRAIQSFIPISPLNQLNVHLQFPCICCIERKFFSNDSRMIEMMLEWKSRMILLVKHLSNDLRSQLLNFSISQPT